MEGFWLCIYDSSVFSMSFWKEEEVIFDYKLSSKRNNVDKDIERMLDKLERGERRSTRFLHLYSPRII